MYKPRIADRLLVRKLSGKGAVLIALSILIVCIQKFGFM